MPLKFGTSGVRGLVTDMTDFECYRYAMAFGKVLKENSTAEGVIIAGDLRSSSPRIMTAVAAALTDLNFSVVNAGLIPTPAIALAAMDKNMGAIMVTGSHIPDDRNGIKFYMPWGEILKQEEEQISLAASKINSDAVSRDFSDDGALVEQLQLNKTSKWVSDFFCSRYLSVFTDDGLKGLKVVVYQHSTVLREIFPHILSSLGADVVTVGWSDEFIPMDTEAVQNPVQLSEWVKNHDADLLVSADGDGDRPLVVTAQGKVIRGDVLGVLAAQALSADCVATPVSCNTQVEKSGYFNKVIRTKIGSPYVIEAMNDLLGEFKSVVGYEANGGFLTGSVIDIDGHELKPLPTRDAVLPVLMIMLSLNSSSWSDILESLPNRATDSLLLRGVNMDSAKALLDDMKLGIEATQQILGDTFGRLIDINSIDGVRLTFADETVVHFRPSGNAPEFRAYLEADNEVVTQQLKCLAEEFLLSKLA